MPPKQSRLDKIIDSVIRKTDLGNWMGREDAKQSLRAHAYATWSDPEVEPEALLWWLLRRRAIDHIRYEKRHFPRMESLDEEEGNWADVVAPLEHEPPTTAEQRAAALEVLTILRIPGVLSERERDYIDRRFVGEETHDEIAEDERISRTRVQQVIERGLAKLRRKL